MIIQNIIDFVDYRNVVKAIDGNNNIDWYLIAIKRSLKDKWAVESIILIATDRWYIRWANKTICVKKFAKIPTQYLLYIYFKIRLNWMQDGILHHLRLFSKEINDAKKYSTWLYINMRKESLDE